MELICRLCRTPLTTTFVDLGSSPLANAYVKPDQLDKEDPFYPLHVYVCRACGLIQLPAWQRPEAIFTDYAYYSSFSDTWLAHSKAHAEAAIERLALNHQSLVVEVASNDGYLLQYFKARDIPVLGIEPAENVAKTAETKGIPTRTVFFGAQTALTLQQEGYAADYLIGNNVLAHVPDLHSFVSGLKMLLKPQGRISVEFPHVLQLMQMNQFDTIYHEHFSYLSLFVVQRLFHEHGLEVVDVEELSTHGGSLRVLAAHSKGAPPPSEGVRRVLASEQEFGLSSLDTVKRFQDQVERIKGDLQAFFKRARQEGKTVAGYGAPAKGNTLLNFAKVRQEDLRFTVDRSPYKQGHFLPGTRIPIYAPEVVREKRPDYLLILPWNLREEISTQMAYVREWGGRLVVAIPALEIF